VSKTKTDTKTATPAAKPAAQASATPAPKKKRKPKGPSMTMAQKFEVMSMVKEADRNLPDATLAQIIGKKIGRKPSTQTVSDYRRKFGIPNVRKPSISLPYVAAMEAKLRELGVEPASLMAQSADSEA
jgi:hypothetical protein